MKGLNKVILIGNVQPKDPELNYTKTGMACCKFKLVTDESYKDDTGKLVDRAEWHRIVAWGKLGEICSTYLKKGSRIYAEGKIRTGDSYEKDGKTIYPSPEIFLDNMIMLDGRGATTADNGAASKEAANVSEGGSMNKNDDDDLPF
ncbi:MAG: single-stranded DNA-binding protein [Ignavibacteria bacterium]|nr:single-stranded DNA-binding protein [Ignavibacteria bacterium]